MRIADLLAKSARLRHEAHDTVKQAERVQDAVAEILARPVASARAKPVADACAMAKALHLAAAIQVVRAHQRRLHVTVAETRQVIQETALLLAEGMVEPETQELAVKLEKLTGVSVSELGVIAEGWPEV